MVVPRLREMHPHGQRRPGRENHATYGLFFSRSLYIVLRKLILPGTGIMAIILNLATNLQAATNSLHHRIGGGLSEQIMSIPSPFSAAAAVMGVFQCAFGRAGESAPWRLADRARFPLHILQNVFIILYNPIV